MATQMESFDVMGTQVEVVEHTSSITLNEVEGDPVIKWSWLWINSKGRKVATRLGYSKASNDMLSKMPNYRKVFFLDTTAGLGGSTHQFYHNTLPTYDEVKEKVISIIKRDYGHN